MLKLLSKYRTELMGISIIWVMVFHSVELSAMNFLTFIGYGAVDIFLMLSGFGLYFAYPKKTSLFSFYIRRLKRIYPTYVIIALIVMLCIGTFTISSYLINISTIGFWTNHGYFGWYIPALIMFYLWFPLIYKLFIKHSYAVIIGSIILAVLLTVIRVKSGLPAYLMLFVSRIPIFIIGVLLGKLLFNKETIKGKKLIFIHITGLIALITLYILRANVSSATLWSYGYYWYPFVFITPSLCMVIVYLLDKIKIKPLNLFLHFIGTISLELYLLHMKFFDKADELANYFEVPKTIVFIVIVLLIIPLSYYLSKFTNHVFIKKKINNA